MSFKDYLPSETFRKRLLYAILIIAIVLAIVFGIKLISKGVKELKIRSQIKKLPAELQAEARTITLGELQRKDSNSNGIPDWEERLFGLDPTTSGENNKQYIQKKKAEFASATGDQVAVSTLDPDTETSIFARNFLTAVLSLEGSNALTDKALNNIASAAGNSISDYTLPDVLSYWNVKTVDDSLVSRDKYINALLTKLGEVSRNTGSDELGSIAGALAGETDAALTLSPMVMVYRNAANDLAKIYVPSGFLSEHLAVVNSLDHIATGLDNMKYVSTDPARATKGVTQYQVYAETLDKAIKDIQAKY